MKAIPCSTVGRGHNVEPVRRREDFHQELNAMKTLRRAENVMDYMYSSEDLQGASSASHFIVMRKADFNLIQYFRQPARMEGEACVPFDEVDLGLMKDLCSALRFIAESGLGLTALKMSDVLIDVECQDLGTIQSGLRDIVKVLKSVHRKMEL